MMQIQYIDRATGQLVDENPPGLSYLHFLYHHPLGELALQAVAKRKLLTSLYGRLMNRSASRDRIQPFVDEYGIDMSESIKGVDEFRSFNDFFYRKLKPSARPLEDGLVSPADGKLLAFPSVHALHTFFVKGQRFTLTDYLQDRKLADQFSDAALLIVRLAPHDYHRFHFSAAGVAKAAVEIKGHYYSVSPYAVRPNFARVFCENKRSYTLLESDEYGKMLLSPVGATMVGSILHTYPSSQQVNKGDEMGYFAFGGSSILMLVDRHRVRLDEDLLENTRRGLETAVRMGERIGG